MTCKCKLRRSDAIGHRIDAELGVDGRFTVVARAAGALRYPKTGTTERVDASTLADGIETMTGIPVEEYHNGRVIGRVDAARVEGDRILADLVITDPEAITAIRGGLLNEASADYTIGRLDSDGTQQGPFVYRALALIPPGVSRCGPTCSIERPQDRLDCLCGDSAPKEIGAQPVKIKIAGKEYDAGTPEAADAMAAEARRMDSMAGDLAVLRRERSSRIRTDAKRAGVTSRKDADDTTVMQDVIAKVFPTVDLSSASPDFIAGAFACAIADLLDEDPAEGDSSAAPPPKPPAEAGAPPAAGAAGARMDAFEGRQPRKDTDATEPSLPPDVVARNKMVRAGARLAHKED